MQPHYIEVIGTALIVRPVGMHRATIKISVCARNSEAGHKLSLSLREQVIAVLRSTGIDESHIEDGGWSVGHSTWTSKKQLTHILRIQCQEVETFARAMAAVENVFRATRPGVFSGIDKDFSIVENAPTFARTEEANELALREAIRNATGKAAILAEQAGLTLGSVISISEIARPRRWVSIYANQFEDPLEGEEHDSMNGPGYGTVEDELRFTPVTPRQITGMIQVRVCFSASPA